MTDDQQSPPPKPEEQQPSGLSAFWAELKRRKVMRVAITYIIASIGIIEFASVTFEGFGIPLWAFRFVMLMVFMGFPIAIILAWAFGGRPMTLRPAHLLRSPAPCRAPVVGACGCGWRHGAADPAPSPQ